MLWVQIPLVQSQNSACSPSWQPALPACALGSRGQEWGRGITPGMWGQGHGQQGDNASSKTQGDPGELTISQPTCGQGNFVTLIKNYLVPRGACVLSFYSGLRSMMNEDQCFNGINTLTRMRGKKAEVRASRRFHHAG